jgi:hypothetical protein
MTREAEPYPIKCKENWKENLEGQNFIGLKVFKVDM